MASRSPYQAHEKGAEIADALDALDRQLERLRALYEQYFMGTQKLVPAQLHRELERKLRELTQLQIRNTALRFRLNTLTQKFGSYNTYWRRTMRQIEQGRYLPHIARVARKAGREGVEVPEEILAAMPKRMRERVRRDRQRIAERDDAEASAAPEEEGQAVRSPQQRAHQLDERLLGDDFDLDSMFASITSEAEAVVDAREPGGRQEPPKPAAVREVGASLPVATVGAPRASTPPGPQPPRAAPPPRGVYPAGTATSAGRVAACAAGTAPNPAADSTCAPAQRTTAATGDGRAGSPSALSAIRRG